MNQIDLHQDDAAIRLCGSTFDMLKSVLEPFDSIGDCIYVLLKRDQLSYSPVAVRLYPISRSDARSCNP